MKGIKHVFFDLDHTLWDHETNARKVLKDLYKEFDFESKFGITESKFLMNYTKVNGRLWNDYNHGRVEKDYLRNERFRIVLEACRVKEVKNSIELSDYFLYHCPRQHALMDGADMVLEYLVKKYPMSIITNGFEDVQKVKLESSGLDKFFTHLITSESMGKKKPEPAIFQHALKLAGVKSHEAVMIGDNLKADVEGAKGANILPIFYDPIGTVKSDCQWQISHLSELMKIL
ncbi:MAG: YjjG family noncanonical pyrimidine nucleotidase [Cyclobacteriaceae bacterium]